MSSIAATTSLTNFAIAGDHVKVDELRKNVSDKDLENAVIEATKHGHVNVIRRLFAKGSGERITDDVIDKAVKVATSESVTELLLRIKLSRKTDQQLGDALNNAASTGNVAETQVMVREPIASRLEINQLEHALRLAIDTHVVVAELLFSTNRVEAYKETRHPLTPTADSLDLNELANLDRDVFFIVSAYLRLNEQEMVHHHTDNLYVRTMVTHVILHTPYNESSFSFAEAGNVPLMDALLQREGGTAHRGNSLMKATQRDNEGVVRHLLQEPFKEDYDISSIEWSFETAITRGNSNITRAILEKTQVAFNNTATQAFQDLAVHGDADSLAMLLTKEGVEISSRDSYKRDFRHALEEAAFAGHRAVIDVLLQHPIVESFEPGDFNVACLAAIQNGHASIALLLLQKDYLGDAVKAAAGEGQINILDQLLQEPFISQFDQHNAMNIRIVNDALELAIRNNHILCVERLLFGPLAPMITKQSVAKLTPQTKNPAILQLIKMKLAE